MKLLFEVINFCNYLLFLTYPIQRMFSVLKSNRMKKSILFVIILIAMFSCKKDQPNGPILKSVDAIAGSFTAIDGDVTLKAANLTVVNRYWAMYAVNSPWYTNVYALVKGNEFITGSAAQIWWAVPANNPVTFPASTSVYSNLTPDENVRIVEKGLNAGNEVAFLGILDFNPSSVSFPLTVPGFRLGDKLTINTFALTSLPGSSNITITVSTNLAPVDVPATIVKAPLSTVWTIPSGTAMSWSDIVYGTPVTMAPVTITPSLTSSFFEVYDLLDKKAMGNVVITITEVNNGGSTIVKTIPAAGPGNYLAITLSTAKVGWYDSGTISITDTDITVTAVNVPVN
jgi:hypothetical protein